MAVVSDLEGTLTTGATWRGFGKYLQTFRSRPRYWAFLVLRLMGVPLVKLGVFDEQTYRSAWISAMLLQFKGATPADVARMAEWVVEHEMWPRRREDALAEIARHRAAGQRVIVASGTYQPLVEAFARRIGAEALGTPLEFADGRTTGYTDGPIRVRQEKVDQVLAALDGEEIVAAYGDTASDVPLLELAREPVAVYPSPALRQIATARGWRILE